MNFIHSNLLTIMLFLPLLGALVILPLRNSDHLLIRRISLAVAVLEFVLSGIPVWFITPGSSRFRLEIFIPWIHALNINYHLGIDGISIFVVHLITLLTPIGILASWNEIQKQVKEFHILLLVLEMSVIGALISLDLFMFFFWFELGLIPLALLIGIWGHGRRIYAAIKFILFTMGGSAFMLASIIWLWAHTGTFDYVAIQKMIESGQLVLSAKAEKWLFMGFFIAFAVKTPLFPLHTWLPDAHTEAPTAGSVDLAGVLLKLGTYGLIRFCLPLFPHASHWAAPWIGVLAVISIIYGALVSMVQPNLKRLVAYSSVSHMGFVVLGIFSFSLIGLQGAIFVMLAHGISTGALFLLVGMLYERRHTFEIAEFGGLATPMPTYAALFLFTVLASMGLPLLCNFVGEFFSLSGTFQTHPHWAVWAATGVIWSSCYLLWAYQRTFYGPVTNPKNLALPDLDHREHLGMFVLCFLMLWLGVNANFFLSRYEVSCQIILQQASPDLRTEASRARPQTAPPSATGVSQPHITVVGR
ncbi:MAG: complex I subunit 4 family protein [Candidatus Korobacteraceae bacterium]